ncbi:MAG: hypothetical protein AAF551_00560, partial [Bacteroidota bacterium]
MSLFEIISLRIVFLVTAITFSQTAFSQENTVGINTENPNPNAVLHLVSPNGNQGLMIPQLTAAQRDNMTLGVDETGLLIYVTDNAVFYFWNGTTWEAVSNTDAQTLDNVLALGADAGGNRIENMGDPVDAQDAATKNYVDNLPDVDNQDLTLVGNTLSLTNDATTVDLTGYLDNTDAQDLTLAGTTLSLTGDATTVDLSTIANTDNQDLTLAGNTLSLTNDATTVDLSGYLDNTDAQYLTLAGTTLSLTGDATTVDLSTIANTDNQDLTLAGKTLSLTNDATTVDLSGYLDNTDAQDLTLAGTTLSLTGDATPVDLST